VLWVGTINQSSVTRIISRDEFLRNQMLTAEYQVECLLKQASLKEGRAVEGLTVVFDLANFEFLNFDRAFMAWFNAQNAFREANHPETLMKAIVINAPSFFPMVWAIAKQAMPANTREKVVICSGSYQDTLDGWIAKDNMPVKYGGTRANEEFYRHVQPEMVIPESLFVQGSPESAMNEVWVGRGSLFNLDLEVESKRARITWEWRSEGCDIMFGIWRKVGGSLEEVTPMERKDSHLHPEIGEIQLQEAGTYVLQWDNTESWITSKKVLYDVNVVVAAGRGCA